jgi:hypothetical protein
MCSEDTRKVLFEERVPIQPFGGPEGAYIFTIKRVPNVAAIARPEGSLAMFVLVRISRAIMAVPRRVVPIL